MASGYYDITNKTLGKGHYGVVKLGRHCLTGEPVAIKIIEKYKLNKDSLNQLGTEISILFRLSEYEHPNILKLYQTIDSEDKLFLVTEYCGPKACDLHDYLIRKHSTEGLSEREAQIFFIQICSAISYCHSMGIVHRDLKPENILVTDYRHMHTNTVDKEKNEPQYPLLKLIDFGFANQSYPDKKMRTSCGTLAYSAPELLLGEPYDGTKVDVWGLGLMLYILLYGGNPFMQINDNETLTKILDCSFVTPNKANIDHDAVELLRSLIKRNPDTRLPIDAIIEHKWFANVPKPFNFRLKYQSEEEKRIHERVVQEMSTNAKLMHSKSSIESSLKNAHLAHRLFNHNSIQPSQFKKGRSIGGLVNSLLDTSIKAKDDETRAQQSADEVDEEKDDKLGSINVKLSNDDYIYASYQLIRDKMLRVEQEKLHQNEAFSSETKHHETSNSTGGAYFVGKLNSFESSMAFCLPLARKCSLVSEESGCSNDCNDSKQ